MAKISRFAYAQMFGPTTGDKVRLADTELFIEVEKDLTVYGEEVKFGGGKVIRDGMGQSQVSRAQGAVDTVITNALIVDATGIYKADIGAQGRPHRGDRQGRQSGHAAGRDHHHRTRHRGDRRRRQDPDRRRHGRAYPLHLPATDRRSADVGRHHHARRRHRPGAWDAGHHLHAGAVASCPHDPGVRRLPDEYRPVGQGQCLAARRAGRDGAGRRLLAEAARGLGHHAGGDRLLPVGRRPVRRAGHDPHRHAERERLRRRHRRRLQGPHHPCLPHRGRGRRPCARHHQGVRTAERHPVFDQSDAALHRQHHRRASGHADGVPSSVAVDPGGCGLCRKPHPQGDHRCRGHPARPRRLLDHLVRQPGDGPRRRSRDTYLADRRQDEAPARPIARGNRRQRQFPGAPLHRQIHDQSGDRARAVAGRSAPSRSASAPISFCGTPPSSASSRTWC